MLMLWGAKVLDSISGQEQKQDDVDDCQMFFLMFLWALAEILVGQSYNEMS